MVQYNVVAIPVYIVRFPHPVSCNFSQGGDEKARKRHTSKGKMLPRDRISCLLDPGYVLCSFSFLISTIDWKHTLTIDSCFSVHHYVTIHAGSLESTKEA